MPPKGALPPKAALPHAAVALGCWSHCHQLLCPQETSSDGKRAGLEFLQVISWPVSSPWATTACGGHLSFKLTKHNAFCYHYCYSSQAFLHHKEGEVLSKAMFCSPGGSSICCGEVDNPFSPGQTSPPIQSPCVIYHLHPLVSLSGAQQNPCLAVKWAFICLPSRCHAPF